MPERISKESHEYAGRPVKVGDRFHVEPGDVAIMLAMGRIEREEGDSVPAHVSRDMVATWPNGYATRDMGVRQKRTYTRKAA